MDTDTILQDLPLSAPPSAADDDPYEERSPTEILDELQMPTLTDARQRKLIRMALPTRFDLEQAVTLRTLLRCYVDAYHPHRDSDEEVVVAAAICKFIATLPVAELLECQDWLTVERKLSAPLEMEVVKMIARKLTATLPEDPRYLDPLGDQLIDLVRAYLNPRVLSKRFFAVTVYQSLLSLALMCSRHLPEAAFLLRGVRSEVIRSVTARQAKLLSADIQRQFPGIRSESPRQALSALVTAAESVQP